MAWITGIWPPHSRLNVDGSPCHEADDISTPAGSGEDHRGESTLKSMEFMSLPVHNYHMAQ